MRCSHSIHAADAATRSKTQHRSDADKTFFRESGVESDSGMMDNSLSGVYVVIVGTSYRVRTPSAVA